MPVAYAVAIATVAGALLSLLSATLGRRLLRGRIAGLEAGLERRPPRLGGLAAGATAVGVSLALGYAVPASWHPVLPWVLAMYLLGLVDDVVDLPPRLKFLGQAVICLAVTSEVRFSPISTPDGSGLSLGPLAVPFTAFWLLLVVNGVNFMDGADGLAGGFVVLVSSAIAILARWHGHGDVAAILAVFAGAHAGFLVLNWRPARLYLGDAGSLGAGFVLAIAGVLATNPTGATIGLHTNLFLFWLPLTELALTVGRRFVRGQPLARGDDRHIHHMMIVSGRRADVSVALLLGLASLTATAAVVSSRWRSLPVAVLIGLLVLATLLGVLSLGYVELRVLSDRLVRLAARSRRRGEVLVRVAEHSHRIRRASSWLEIQSALRSLVEDGLLDRAQLVPRDSRAAAEPLRAWTLEGDLGAAERPGYTLLVRSSGDELEAVRPDDVRNYLVPALESALERLGVEPAIVVAEQRSQS